FEHDLLHHGLGRLGGLFAFAQRVQRGRELRQHQRFAVGLGPVHSKHPYCVFCTMAPARSVSWYCRQIALNVASGESCSVMLLGCAEVMKQRLNSTSWNDHWSPGLPSARTIETWNSVPSSANWVSLATPLGWPVVNSARTVIVNVNVNG